MTVKPLWEVFAESVPPQPAPADTARCWRWKEVRPKLDHALRTITAEDAERRVLLYVNPDLAPTIATTSNLQAGMQALGAGEHALPHRHSPAALRFVVEGGDAYTEVEGRKCPMSAGDLILTPAWCWHAHRNVGTSPVIWLDVLDVPLIRSLDAMFFEARPPSPVPESDGAEAFLFAWADVASELASAARDADGTRRLRYEAPQTGGPVMPTLDCWAVEIDQPTRRIRSTSNAICFVVDGSGRSRIGDTEFSWTAHDTFTIPHWTWAEHMTIDGTSRLFVVTDAEVMRRIGQFRKEVED